MKPVDVKSNTYIDSTKEISGKNPKCKICDIIRISKYKNILTKGQSPTRSEETFLINKGKTTVPWAYIISDLNREVIVGAFYEKNAKKTSQIVLNLKSN